MAETTKPTAQEIEAALLNERRAWHVYSQQHDVQHHAGNLKNESGELTGEAKRRAEIYGQFGHALDRLGDRLLAAVTKQNEQTASLALSACENDEERDAVLAAARSVQP